MPPKEKLRPIKAVADAYRFVFDHLPQLARLCSGWLGLALILFVVFIALFMRLIESGTPSGERFQALPLDAQVGAIVGIPSLVVILAVPLIIVAWHRVIIKQVQPSIFPMPLGGALLYLARTLLIGLIWPLTVGVVGFLPIVYIGKLSLDANLILALKITVVAAAAVLGALVTARLLLVLPAGAVGDWSVTLAKSWRLTAGSGLRLAVGFVLAAAPLFAINAASNIFVHAIEDEAVALRSAIVIMVVSTLLSLAAALIEATFLSFAYLFFTGGERS